MSSPIDNKKEENAIPKEVPDAITADVLFGDSSEPDFFSSMTGNASSTPGNLTNFPSIQDNITSSAPLSHENVTTNTNMYQSIDNPYEFLDDTGYDPDNPEHNIGAHDQTNSNMDPGIISMHSSSHKNLDNGSTQYAYGNNEAYNSYKYSGNEHYPGTYNTTQSDNNYHPNYSNYGHPNNSNYDPIYSQYNTNQGGVMDPNLSLAFDSSKSNYNTGYDPHATNYDPNYTGYDPHATNYDPNYTGYDPHATNYDPNYTGYDQNNTNFDPNHTGYDPNIANYDPSYTGYNTNGYNYAGYNYSSNVVPNANTSGHVIGSQQVDQPATSINHVHSYQEHNYYQQEISDKSQRVEQIRNVTEEFISSDGSFSQGTNQKYEYKQESAPNHKDINPSSSYPSEPSGSRQVNATIEQSHSYPGLQKFSPENNENFFSGKDDIHDLVHDIDLNHDHRNEVNTFLNDSNQGNALKALSVKDGVPHSIISDDLDNLVLNSRKNTPLKTTAKSLPVRNSSIAQEGVTSHEWDSPCQDGKFSTDDDNFSSVSSYRSNLLDSKRCAFCFRLNESDANFCTKCGKPMVNKIGDLKHSFSSEPIFENRMHSATSAKNISSGVISSEELNSKRNKVNKIANVHNVIGDGLKRNGCPLVSFGFGGKLVVMFTRMHSRFQNTSGSLTQTSKLYHGLLQIHKMKDLMKKSCPLLIENILKYPLSSNKYKKAMVLKWIDQSISTHPDYVFKFLKVLCENDGKSVNDPVCLNALKGIIGQQSPVMHHFSVLPQPSDKSLSELTNFVVQGAYQEAVDFCVREQIWNHALVISGYLGPEKFREVVNKFSTNFETGHVLNTIYGLIGKRAPFFDGNVDNILDNWMLNLSAIMSARKVEPVALKQLGNLLKKVGRVDDAHFCLLLDENALGGFGSAENTVVLLGSDESYSNFGSMMVNWLSFQKTECLENLLRLKNKEFLFPHLMPYRLLYAYFLIELGLVDEANKNIETIVTSLKNLNKRSPYIHKSFLDELKELEMRLIGSGIVAQGGDGGFFKNTLGSTIFNAFDKFIVGEEVSTTRVASPIPSVPVNTVPVNQSPAAVPMYQAAGTAKDKYVMQATPMTYPTYNPPVPNTETYSSESKGSDIQPYVTGGHSFYSDHSSGYSTYNSTDYSATRNVSLQSESQVPSTSPPTVPNVQNFGNADDEDDNGFGNGSLAKRKPPTQQDSPSQGSSEPEKDDSKRTISRSSYLSITGAFKYLWGTPKKEEQPAPTPSKANLGEENQFYYDKELKKWVNSSNSSKENVTATGPPPRTDTPSGTTETSGNIAPPSTPFSSKPSSRSVSPFPMTETDKRASIGRRSARSRYVDAMAGSNNTANVPSTNMPPRANLPLPNVHNSGNAGSVGIMNPRSNMSGRERNNE